MKHCLCDRNTLLNCGHTHVCYQVKEKEAELKAAEQRLHDEFEKLRTKNQEEKRLQDDKRRQLVSPLYLVGAGWVGAGWVAAYLAQSRGDFPPPLGVLFPNLANLKA